MWARQYSGQCSGQCNGGQCSGRCVNVVAKNFKNVAILKIWQVYSKFTPLCENLATYFMQ